MSSSDCRVYWIVTEFTSCFGPRTPIHILSQAVVRCGKGVNVAEYGVDLTALCESALINILR